MKQELEKKDSIITKTGSNYTDYFLYPLHLCLISESTGLAPLFEKGEN
jgi:hypothetical protein